MRVPLRLPRTLVAGLAAGAVFDAVNLGLRGVLGAPSLPEDLSDLLVPLIPASLFGKLLAALGPHGKQVVFVSSLLGLALGVAVAVLIYARLSRRWGVLRATGALVIVGWLGLAAIFWTVLDANDAGGSLLTRRLLAIADLGLGAGAAAIVATLLVGLPSAGTAAREMDPGRRRLLGGMGAALALLAIGGGGIVAGVRQLLTLSNLGYEGYGTPASALGAITPTRNFYVVSKNLIDPVVDAGEWRLVIDGLVDRERTLSMADLHQVPQVESIATLECIANGVGGSLMSTARWEGPRLVDVLALAGTSRNPTHVELTAIDGYYDAVRVDELSVEGAVLALRMNGEVLPDRHGYPARVVLPGRYGEKQMKWLTGMRLTNTPRTGFYQRQGWSELGTIRTWSRFDNIRDGAIVPAGSDLAIAGHAFAGTRGVDAVQVSIDDGRTWLDAGLDAVISKNAWRYFHWTWRAPSPGTYSLVVRARDGQGAFQETSYDDIVPRGSSGLHRVGVHVV